MMLSCSRVIYKTVQQVYVACMLCCKINIGSGPNLPIVGIRIYSALPYLLISVLFSQHSVVFLFTSTSV